MIDTLANISLQVNGLEWLNYLSASADGWAEKLQIVYSFTKKSSKLSTYITTKISFNY